MYSSHIRYLATAFVDASAVDFAPHIADLMNVVPGVQLIPQGIQEELPDRIVTRYLLANPGSEWQIALLSKRIDVNRITSNPIHGSDLGSFNQAETYLINQNKISGSIEERSHERVWKAFAREGGTLHNAIYKNGDQLKKKRRSADYDPTDKKWSEEVKLSINVAKNIESYLNKIKAAKERN